MGSFGISGEESPVKSPKFKEEAVITERNVESEDSKLELGKDPPLYLFDQDIRIAGVCGELPKFTPRSYPPPAEHIEDSGD